MKALAGDDMFVPSSLVVIAFGCGHEIFVHEKVLSRYDCFLTDRGDPRKIRIDAPYNGGGYLVVHWLYRQDLRHNYVGIELSLEAYQYHIHALVEAYAIAIKIGLEDLANEISHLIQEFFYDHLPSAMLRTTAIQLANHGLQDSGLMWMTLEKGSQRFTDLEYEREEEKEEEQEETSYNLFGWYWNFPMPSRGPMRFGTCRYHEHNYTTPCDLRGTNHMTTNLKNVPEHLSNETLMRMYTSPIILLIAGGEEQAIYAHKEILERSKFFNACLHPQHFKEGVEQAVVLPEDHPDAITIAVEFLYRGHFSIPKKLGGRLYPECLYPSTVTILIDLYLTADRLYIEKMANDIVTVRTKPGQVSQ